MKDPLKQNILKQMDYPGRGIVIGSTKLGELFGAYFVTGRSPSSKARRFVKKGNIISTEPTKPKTLAKGNPDLLIYNAIAWYQDLVVISNGKQTDSIFTASVCNDTDIPLSEATSQWNYEPDDPNFTPRISGRIMQTDPENYGYMIELGIIKKGRGTKAIRSNSELDPNNGIAYGVTTYRGANRDPLPSYKGNPFVMSIEGHYAEEICEEISDLLKPEFRVGVAAVVLDRGNVSDHHIMNFTE